MTRTTAGAGAPMVPLPRDETRLVNHLPQQAMTGTSGRCN